MRRVYALVGVTLLALGAQASVAHATMNGGHGGGEVKSLSVVPAAGRAEVVIAVGGDVDVQDFTLSSPPRIVLDLKGAKLTATAKLYDKVARGGIKNVRIAQYREDVVRVVLDLDGERQYTVTRGADELRVAVGGNAGGSFAAWRTTPDIVGTGSAAGQVATRQPAAAPARSTRASTAVAARPTPFSTIAAQPRITVTYQDADVRDVIAAFAMFSGRTIVTGKGVTGNVSAEIHDQPWDVALRAILSSQGLAAKEDSDGIIHVDSYANIAAQQSSEPLTTQIITVNYARAASLVPTIKSLLVQECPAAAPGGQGGAQGATQCKTRGNVVADTATNRLIVTDVPSRIQDIAAYVKDLDVRTPQVAIKAKIIVVNRTNIEDIGIAYDLRETGKGGLIMQPGVPQVTIGGNSLGAVANANQRVASPALELLFSTALGKFNLTSFIGALQDIRLADVQAEPTITTLDNRRAEILSGVELPLRIVDPGSISEGGPKTTIQLKETGIILNVTPHITNNRKILMQMHAERSSIELAGGEYSFPKQRADAELLVGDGETAVIGGLTMTTVNKTKAGIPFLVDLPVLGRLFGRTKTEETKSDLLILVTPHIVDEGETLGPPGN
jgi:type IV pilus assembly protein PilQ